MKNRARKRRRGRIKPDPNAEMLTIAECAKKMRCSPETARNRLRNEPGVISTGRAETRKGLRKYIEAILISAAEPPHNRQGGRFGEEVGQYLQYRDDKALGPDVDSMVKELWKKVNLSA